MGVKITLNLNTLEHAFQFEPDFTEMNFEGFVDQDIHRRIIVGLNHFENFAVFQDTSLKFKFGLS